MDLIRHKKSIWRKEISDWQRARHIRCSEENPQNYLLQEVYEDTMMDGQLTGITENRTFRTTNKDFIFVDKEGKKNKPDSYEIAIEAEGCKDEILCVMASILQREEWLRDIVEQALEMIYEE